MKVEIRTVPKTRFGKDEFHVFGAKELPKSALISILNNLLMEAVFVLTEAISVDVVKKAEPFLSQEFHTYFRIRYFRNEVTVIQLDDHGCVQGINILFAR